MYLIIGKVQSFNAANDLLFTLVKGYDQGLWSGSVEICDLVMIGVIDSNK